MEIKREAWMDMMAVVAGQAVQIAKLQHHDDAVCLKRGMERYDMLAKHIDDQDVAKRYRPLMERELKERFL